VPDDLHTKVPTSVRQALFGEDMMSPGPAELPDTRKLRIGLLVDSTSGSKYVHDFVRWANAQEGVSVSHLVVHAAPRGRLDKFRTAAQRDGFYFALSELAFKAWTRVEDLLLRRFFRRYQNHATQYELVPALSRVPSPSTRSSPSQASSIDSMTPTFKRYAMPISTS